MYAYKYTIYQYFRNISNNKIKQGVQMAGEVPSGQTVQATFIGLTH